MDFRDLIAKGDALTVIKKLKLDLEDRSENEAAHSLAARGYNLTSPSCWIEEVPTEVESTVVNDQRRYLSL
ncbi:hypothetical protein Goshw_020082 [Gossypium schwendimanii]|uniref:Uncharacterized protein n=1 Tax=Gossypium schwendimanii TaxID=34291 RepID=A0A7J9N226_GOSSC|nr:hypothetical protein [Gossypium schwendimanii]